MARKPKKRKPGRPSKYTPELGKAIIAAIAAGASIPEACKTFRIGATTFHEWVRDGKYPQFAQGIQEAKSDRIGALEERVVLASKKDWRAAFELLKVYDPKRFASKVRVTIEQELSDSLKRLKNALPPAIYEQVLVALVEGAGGAGTEGDSGEEAAEAGGAGGEAVHPVATAPGAEDVPRSD